MTGENIVSGLCHLEDALYWSVLGGRSNRRVLRPSHKLYSSQLCQVSGEFVIRGFSPQGAFVISTFIALLGLEKSHFSIDCLVLQINRFVTGGGSLLPVQGGPLLSQTIFGSELSRSFEGCIFVFLRFFFFFALPLEMPLVSMIKP